MKPKQIPAFENEHWSVTLRREAKERVGDNPVLLKRPRERHGQEQYKNSIETLMQTHALSNYGNILEHNIEGWVLTEFNRDFYTKFKTLFDGAGFAEVAL